MAKPEAKGISCRTSDIPGNISTPKGKCAVCGKKTIAEGLCEKHYVEKHPLLLEFKEIEIRVCPSCSRYFSEGKWKEYKEIQQVIMEHVLGALKYNSTADDAVIEQLTPDMDKKAEATIKGEAATTVKGQVAGEKITDKYTIPFKVIMATCSKCGKKNSQYFEGIFQLRAGNVPRTGCTSAKGSDAKSGENDEDRADRTADALQKAAEFARSVVRKHSHKGVYITKEKTVYGGAGIAGIDFYITSQKFIQWLGRRMQEEFGGELVISSTLFSRNKQTSRDIYRVNALLKLPEFSKGDIIFSEGRVLRINSLGKKITCTELCSGKKMSLTGIDRFESLPVHDAVVCAIRPDILVIHPITFDAISLENAEVYAKNSKLAIGDNVKVVVHGARVWLLM